MNKDIALALRIRVLLFWGKIAFRVRICFIVHRRNCFWSKALFHEWSEVPSCLPMSVRELSASLSAGLAFCGGGAVGVRDRL